MSTTSPTPNPDDGELDEIEPEIASAVDAFTLPPGADPTIDWGLTSHLHADGTPKIIERHLVVPPELAACASITSSRPRSRACLARGSSS